MEMMRKDRIRLRYNRQSSENDRREAKSPRLSDGSLSKTRKRRRTKRRTLDGIQLFRCAQLLAIFCIVYASQYVLPPMDEYSNSPALRSSHQLDYATRKRRSRTRPSPIIEGSVFSVFNHSQDSYSMDSIYPFFPTTDYVAGDDICGHHEKKNAYNSNDRIIISGIFSHPVAAELALTLAEICGVRNIVGLSDHFLNTEESSRLEYLLRRIPDLQLKVKNGPLGERATQELFESFLPSHVFYFESKSFKISIGDKNDAESSFATHAGTSQLEQICNTIIKRNSKSKEKKKATTSLLYVSSGLHDANTNALSATILSKSNLILLEAYRIQYQLDVRVLDLPNIFGPFEEGALWLSSDEFFRGAHEIAGHDQISTRLNMTQPIISIAAAIRSILVSGKLGHIPENQQVPILASQKSQTTTLLNLSKNLLPFLSNPSTIDVADIRKALGTSLLPIISWNYKKTKPYRDLFHHDKSPIEGNKSKIENDEIVALSLRSTRDHLKKNIEHTPFSLLERRQHDLFPCVSTCVNFVNCRPSIWDRIAPISLSATNGCKFLLYMADFSPTLKELPLVRESTNNAVWPRDEFCQLAFVSSQSALVENAIQEEVKLKGDEASKNKTKEEWNGQISSNNWKLVWIDETDESINPADSVIPKINPEKLLDPQMQFIFYIEPHHFDLIPPLQIMWFLMARQLVVGSHSKKDNSGTNRKWVFPEANIGFFAHAYNKSDVGHLDSTKSDYITKAAKFMLEQNSKSTSGQENAFQKFDAARQNEAYTSSLIWQKEEGLKFELVDTALMISKTHDIHAKQFRCEWFEEELFWSNEDHRNLESLSLSFVLHRWRRLGRLLQNTFDDKWGEMILLGENGEELSPSDVWFSKSVKNEEEVTLPEPQHFIKIHSSLSVRKFYTYK